MNISTNILEVLRVEQISEEELALMLKRAARTRLRGFNRRYFHWLFKIEGDELVAMQHVDVIETGSGSTKMFEDHEPCDGHGCHDCGWVGQIGRWVTDKVVPRLESLNDMLTRGTAKRDNKAGK